MKPKAESFSHKQFASDNYSGICPEAWEAMKEANVGHAPAYGEDIWTEQASNMLRELFEYDCEVFFTFNGTAANSLALASLCHSYHSIICSDVAHVETDECGAPEFFSNGTKILLASNELGKIQPDSVEQLVRKRSDIHYPKPKVLSITQATELGSVYSVKELDRLSETARRCNLRVHMDGARFTNAVAALNVSPKEITWKIGVDVLCFGGTKMGLPIGEAVIFFDSALAEEFAFRCKQSGQLASKMRFLASPWVGMLRTGAWLKYAAHANKMALLLKSKLEKFPDVEVLYTPEANSVFLRIPEHLKSSLGEAGWKFYTFIGGGVRLMCSWDTTESDVELLVRDLAEAQKDEC